MSGRIDHKAEQRLAGRLTPGQVFALRWIADGSLGKAPGPMMQRSTPVLERHGLIRFGGVLHRGGLPTVWRPTAKGKRLAKLFRRWEGWVVERRHKDAPAYARAMARRYDEKRAAS